LVARVLPNPREPVQNRFAVVAGKKVGKAVERNRAKRLVREALRRLNPQLKQGHDIVVIVRGTSEELPGYEVAAACLERIVKRARLLKELPVASCQLPEATSGDAKVQTATHPSAVHRDN
jgi:ribonuclease P protein component